VHGFGLDVVLSGFCGAGSHTSLQINEFEHTLGIKNVREKGLSIYVSFFVELRERDDIFIRTSSCSPIN